ncbi:MAG: hypothetical protein KDA20_10840 [Phycisphaerales bacterium]|nr:hypothetical protein [Phycisphaerales bacterium]
MGNAVATKVTVGVSVGDASPEGAAAQMVGAPVGVMRVGGFASALAGLVALGGIGVGLIALSRGDTTQGVWFLILWEAVALIGAAYGALGGLARRFGSGPALALLIAAGCGFVAAVLNEPGLVTKAMGRTVNWAAPGGIRILPLVGAQLALSVVLGACSAAAVLLRAPGRALGSLVRGLVLLAPAMAGLAAFGLPRLRGPILAWLSGHAILGAGVVVIGGLLLAGLFCVGVHKVIRAFEIGIAAGLVKAGEAGGSDKCDLGQKAAVAEVTSSVGE